MLSRRSFLAGVAAWPLRLAADGHDPADLIEPAELANLLRSGHSASVVICVGFGVLYRQKHIPGALFAGPAHKPEGIAELKRVISRFNKNTDTVIYCGCCPMIHCPNVRPASEALMQLGYKRISILNLPNNFYADWTEKGYPVQP